MTHEHHLTSRLQSLLQRMSNDERTSTMFEADGDTLRDAMDYIRKAARGQSVEPLNERLSVANCLNEMSLATIQALQGVSDEHNVAMAASAKSACMKAPITVAQAFADFEDDDYWPDVDDVKGLSQPAKKVELTKEDVLAVGGIVHRDGNVFFTNIALLNKAIEAAKERT